MEWLLNIQQAVKSMWDVVGRLLNRRSFCALVFFHFCYDFVVFFHYLFFLLALSFTSTRFLCFLSSFALICDFTSVALSVHYCFLLPFFLSFICSSSPVIYNYAITFCIIYLYIYHFFSLYI